MSAYMNEAGWDRAVRIVLGLVLLTLGWSGIVAGTWGLIFRAFGFLPLATGLLGWCPAYALFGFTTRKPSAVV